ncbi:type II secretion system protein [Ideonella paludis]|uniref:type II secretion system protein n=1 Tax=Ideonella paludis TaxID=1233411 RepID=UPI0036306F6C
MTSLLIQARTRLRAGRSARGFSLVELSIGLMILGALMAGGVYLLDMSSKRGATDKLNPVRMAEHALVAYAHAKGKLPPPKDPEPSSVAGYRQGKVPWDALGLPDAGGVRYVVDEAMLSDTQVNTYQPNLRGESVNAGPSGILGAAVARVSRERIFASVY